METVRIITNSSDHKCCSVISCLFAIVLLCLVFVLTGGAAKAVWADEFILSDGTTMSGAIVEGHSLSIMVWSDVGGVKPVMINTIDQIRVGLVDGNQIEGRLLSWRDGMSIIKVDDYVVTVKDGYVTRISEPSVAAPEIQQSVSPQVPAGKSDQGGVPTPPAEYVAPPKTSTQPVM